MFLRSRKHRLRMEAIDGYSANTEIVDNSALITVYAHTQSMGTIPLFSGAIKASYYETHPTVDFYDIGLEILFDCFDAAITEEINVTPLGRRFSDVLAKLDGTTPITAVERKVLTAVTGRGVYVKILRENGSRVGPEPVGVPRYRAMDDLLERAYPDRPQYETDYEVSFLNEHGEVEIAGRAKIDDLLNELDSLTSASPDHKEIEDTK